MKKGIKEKLEEIIDLMEEEYGDIERIELVLEKDGLNEHSITKMKNCIISYLHKEDLLNPTNEKDE